MRAVRILLVLTLLVLQAWLTADQYYFKNHPWPVALALGMGWVVLGALVIRQCQPKPAPFQFFVRLTSQGPDAVEHERLLATLLDLFKRSFPRSNPVRFDGFDTDGEWVWFHFHGPGATGVSEAVLRLIAGLPLPTGAYFEAVSGRKSPATGMGSLEK